MFLKRVTIVLDEDSEKGFGLVSDRAIILFRSFGIPGLLLRQASTSSSIFSGYDIIALTPTTPGTLSVACLTHSQPSALTAHVISLPLTFPRLPFHLKHTLIRTAIKNGAVFEMNYSGAFGGDPDGFETVSVAIKRNWWAAAREVIRVTKGKGVIVSGGVTNEPDLRAPRDIANLCVDFIPALTVTLIRTLGNRITMLGLAQDVAHSTMSKEPQALVLRARESTYTCLSRLLRPTFHEETRRTYRAILSEPRLVIPGVQPQTIPQPPQEAPAGLVDAPTSGTKRPFDEMGDAQSKSPTKTETRPNKKRKNKQR